MFVLHLFLCAASPRETVLSIMCWDTREDPQRRYVVTGLSIFIETLRSSQTLVLHQTELEATRE